MQVIYRLLYQPTINFILRNLLRSTSILFKVVQLPPSGILKIRLRDGHSIKLRTNQTNYVTKLLFWDGYRNFEYLDIFEKLIRKISVFYDVGANIGLYSIVAGTVNKRIQVRSFEPSNGPFHYLQRNASINQLANTKIEQIALADTNGSLNFYQVANSKYTYLKHNLAGEGNFNAKESNKQFETTSVKSCTLDTYAQGESHTIELIKLDTEGTEHLILNGAVRVLDEMRPIVICETLFSMIEEELEDLFRSRNYKFFNHKGKYLEETKTITRTVDNGIRNCFFVPEEKVGLIAEFVTD